MRRILLLIMLACGLALAAGTVRYGRADGLASEIVGGGVEAPDGLMWFATWNGLHCYDGYDFYRVTIMPGDSSTINTNLIRYIASGAEGKLLCRTDDGIYEFDLSTLRFGNAPVDNDSVSRMLGKVWHGTTVTQGNAEILWTRQGAGLGKTVSPHHPATVLPGTEGKNIRSIAVDSLGRIIAGSRDHPRLTVIDGDGVTNTSDTDFAPYCIFETRDGMMFYGGKPRGLIRGDGTVISDGDDVYDIAEDSAGRLWLATWGGGVKYIDRPVEERPEVKSTGVAGKVRKLLITPGGRIVAATTDGLLAIDPADGSVRHVRRRPAAPSSLSSNATISLAADKAGNIYVATQSSGISRVTEESLFSENPVFSHFNVAGSALDSDEILGMAIADDTTLIVTGPDRVMILNPSTGRSTGYSASFWGDDVSFSEGTPVMTSDGTWMFPSADGVLTATAHSLYSRGFVPRLRVMTVSVNGSPERLVSLADDRLDLDSRSRNVTLRFAAIDYVDNSHILYRYRLDGSPWSAFDPARSLTLFNLSPGKHTVELQSTDRYGRPVDNTLAITLNVAYRWYETWWAAMCFIILIAGIAVAVVWTIVYIRRVNRNRRDLLEKYMALLENAPRREAVEPEEKTNVPVVESAEDAAFLNRVQAFIESNISNPEADIDAMADAAAVSRATLNRRLKSLMGISGAKLLAEARLQRASAMLDGDETVTVADVAAATGYSDPYYFARVYKKRFGKAPR